MQTLSDFVNKQIKNYNLNNDEKIFFKIRIKAQRELEKMDLWQNAKTETIGKAKTRVFSKEQLGQLEIKLAPYLEKLSTKEKNLNYDEVKALASKIADGENPEFAEKEMKNFYKQAKNSVPAPIISKKDVEQEKQKIMIEALFEHFFTPIDTEKLEDLMTTIKLTDDDFKKASALEELKHPEDHLFQRKTFFNRLKNKG